MNRCILSMILIAVSTVKMSSQEQSDVITFPVGDAKISVLSEGQQNNKPTNLIGASPEILSRFVPDGTYPAACNAFLVRTNGKNVLIDAGFGRNLFKNIESLGLSTEQIDAVLLTHAHGDHIGGLLKDGKAAFPNAELCIARPEYDYWTADERKNSLTKIIEEYGNRLRLFDASTDPAAETDALYGLKPVAAPGHTPGHTAFLIESGDERLLVWGDLTHATAVQMPHPEVAVTYDVDAKQAVETRIKILEYVAKNKIQIAGMHIAFPAIGSVKQAKNGEGYEFTPQCTCFAM